MARPADLQRSRSLEDPAALEQLVDSLVSEETAALHRVLTYVQRQAAASLPDARVAARGGLRNDYDGQLLELRDQIAEARLEDVPPLIERMSQLQHLRGHLPGGARPVTRLLAGSPYFGRLVLEEDGRRREVLIGTTTHIDTAAGVRIVDWRDAPVSRLYYRYREGEDYIETFGDRQREGEVLLRRSVTIQEGVLTRISSPRVTLVRRGAGWRQLVHTTALSGGQGTSTSAQSHTPALTRTPRGRLGSGEDGEQDRRLKQITALIDRQQFDLITRPDSGLVVIQGGAGSGKTTIGLHRIAYLHYHKPRRFAPNRMLIVVFNAALARYIARAVSALQLDGIGVRTFSEWSQRLRRGLLPRLNVESSADAPAEVTQLKRHPAMVRAVDTHVERLRTALGVKLSLAAPPNSEIQHQIQRQWLKKSRSPLAHQLFALRKWVDKAALPLPIRHALERAIQKGQHLAQDILTAWAEVLTDEEQLRTALGEGGGRPLSDEDLRQAIRYCADHGERVLEHAEALASEPDPQRKHPGDVLSTTDGQALDETASLTTEDDAILLRLAQRLRGPLLRDGSKEALVYEHLFVDEAQDLSPLELCVLMGTVSGARSVTLAGDVAQRQHMNNGFTSWSDTLSQLSLRHVQVEPLELSYRSTQPIVDFAHRVLGPLAPEQAPRAVQDGPPVELFRFAHAGEAMAFLVGALRDLLSREPRATIALVAKHPAQARQLYQGLARAELAGVRLVLDQEFAFKPGVDVTDVRQVKGLEFDYVIIAEASELHYPADDEARHLLHIAATRAAHQLWLIATDPVSELVPLDVVRTEVGSAEP